MTQQENEQKLLAESELKDYVIFLYPYDFRALRKAYLVYADTDFWIPFSVLKASTSSYKDVPPGMTEAEGRCSRFVIKKWFFEKEIMSKKELRNDIFIQDGLGVIKSTDYKTEKEWDEIVKSYERR